MPDRPLRQDFRRAAPGVFRSASSSFGTPARGFSLIEIIVTLALLAILVGLALPSFGRLLGGSELTATVNELVFSLQSARSEAIKRAGPVALCASASPLAADASCDGASYASGWIVYVDGLPATPTTPATPANGTREASEELILQSEPSGPALTFAADTAVARQVLFVDSGASATVTGTPISGDIRVDHAVDDRGLVVSVGANGRISSGKAP